MGHPFLTNSTFAARYCLGFIVYAALHGAAYLWMLNGLTETIPAGLFFVDGLISALCMAGSGILLGYAVRFGDYPGMPRFQRLINHVVYAILFIGIGVGSSIGLLHLTLNPEHTFYLLPSLGMRAFTALLTYFIIDNIFRSNIEDADLQSIEGENGGGHSAKTPSEPESEVIERITVKSGSKIELISVVDVISILADGDYVSIHTTGGRFLKEQTMKYFDEHLPGETFVRAHRSAIVNMGAILGIELYEKHQQMLTLRNGQKVKCSQEGYRNLKAKLGL